jgi:hypothetical protein
MNRDYRDLRWIGVAVVAFALVSSVIGCGKASERLPLQGKITWQGQPLTKGSILFMPARGHRGPKIGAQVVEGDYQIDADRGATAGAYRVEVRSDSGERPHSPTDERPTRTATKSSASIPPEYNSNSRLSADVSAERTRFDFDLPLASQ